VFDRTDIFVDPTEGFMVERACPGILQALALLFWKFAGGADQCGLLVVGIFSEHALIILKFCRFEVGKPLFAVESCYTSRNKNPGQCSKHSRLDRRKRRFERTSVHEKIVQAIKETCAADGILALRADDKQYTDGLLENVLTCIYGCDFGIAVFERIRRDIYNPNVSYEAGYLMGLNKLPLFWKMKLYRYYQPIWWGICISRLISWTQSAPYLTKLKSG
ncbi:MAG: hypothetical protein JXA13_01925, partial [Anaerolineales bacterium]|nr:hypothetical protein [Anaerolineales bacterium]